jgi:uncharacterized glyoxalase superfamily protein PhnB
MTLPVSRRQFLGTSAESAVALASGPLLAQADALPSRQVADVDAWYAEFHGKGVAVKEPPSQSIQGLRDMTVIDPDGNMLRFCTRLPGWSRK